jgi:hypothetical protein
MPLVTMLKISSVQLYLAIGIPAILNIVFNGFMSTLLNSRITQLESSLKDTWRAELRRVEEVLDARLKHMEERRP